MTVTEKVGQLNQRLYGFHAYERIDPSDTEESAKMPGMACADSVFGANASNAGASVKMSKEACIGLDFGDDASNVGGCHWRPRDDCCQDV
ncbi:MAG: hypothetical protein LUF30_04040 [Lachnospiraceae bacterium]|nr:hypothetical protein [Lachnospiraceae bacterium]